MFGILLVPTQCCDLFGYIVDSRAGSVALGNDVAQAHIQPNGVVELFQQFGLGPPLKGRAHHVGLRTQQPDIYHACQG